MTHVGPCAFTIACWCVCTQSSVCVCMLLVDGRRQLLDINLKGVPLTDDVNLDEIAKDLEGYSGADITNVCRWAATFVTRHENMGLQLST